MGSTNPGDIAVTIQQTSDVKRKVSIITDPVGESRYGYDNLGYDVHSRRKISQTSNSDHIEIGPVRKKSMLVNSANNLQQSLPQADVESLKSQNSYSDRLNGGGANTRNYLNHHLKQSQINENLEESWIFACCMKCRVTENTPSWEPPYWQKMCPYPLFPSYRQFANFLSVVMIGVLLWTVAYVIIGDTAAPGGQLFGLLVLTVVANFGGWLISLTTLPRLIGMLAVGILFQNLGWVDLDGEFSYVTDELRKCALVIILIRAGLEMDPEAFKKIYLTILKLSLVPWMVECTVVAVLSYFLFDFPWIWGFALGSIIAAISPAIVVNCLIRLRTKGYGVAKGIPTCIIAVAGIDDAASVAIFGIIASIMFGTGSMAYQIAQAPVCVCGGLAFGVAWGNLLRFVPEKGDAYLVPIRTLLLLGGGMIAVFGSEKIGFEGAGPLGVVFAAFVSNYHWCKQEGWEVEENPVSTAFVIFWMIFEPILFGITGASIKINELNPNVVTIGIGILSAGVIIRILSTIAIAVGDKLNPKEKVFVSLSWMAKATVQAALGPVCLKKVAENENATEEEKRLAEIVLMICVLSIILTAPIGAFLISMSGTRLLTKTKPLHVVEGWRRSHRPSLYDLSILDEEEDRDIDPDVHPDDKTVANTNTNTNYGRPLPNYTK